MRAWAPSCLLLILVLARTAAATVADDVCPPADDPCVVDHPVAVGPGSMLDFGARALEVRRGGALRAESGGFTISAASLRVLPGGALIARGGPGERAIVITATGDVSIEGTGSARGRIDVSANPAGKILITAGNQFTLGGALIASRIGAHGPGGTVEVDALLATITPLGGIVATGGDLDSGGVVRVTATGPATIGGVVDVSGGFEDGGSIEIGGSKLEITARLDARSRVNAGDGGPITIESPDNVVIRGELVSTSGCDRDDECVSTGGDVDIKATGGSVFLGAPVRLTGEGIDGTGGMLMIDAGTDVVQTAAVLANGRGSEGCGGEVEITAGRNATLGAIDASGRDCDGGAVTVSSDGRVTVAGEIDADGKTGGAGGAIEIRGNANLPADVAAVRASVHASSRTGDGGTVTIEACTIEVAAAADVATRGDGGENDLSAGWQITIAGSLLSGTGASGAGGKNTLRYRSQARPPAIAPDAVITPAATLEFDSRVPACLTPLTPECGNGVLDPGEECDDFNTDASDGCSSTCTLEGCGNHTVEADRGEECDDGNADPCDGCSPTCTVERCGNGTVECAEACDAGDGGAPESGCDASCALVPPPGCGDDTRGPGENCDDGGTAGCDGCSSICQIETCGNGVVECGEQCDDGNQSACDGCSATCTLERCGDGVAQCEEECDLGPDNGAPGGSCDVGCRFGTFCDVVTTESPCIPCAGDRDCDPAGRCGGGACTDGVCGPVPVPSCDDQSPGTIDRCVLDDMGAPRCQHACIGDQVCDDGDGCTVDTCAGVRGCMHAPVIGLAAIGCRIDALAGALRARPGEVRPGLTQKLEKRLAKLARQIDAAGRAGAEGSIGRERRVLRDVVAGLRQLEKIVERARRKNKISEDRAATIGQVAGEASRVAAELRSSLKT
jgi:cysteine-rich repeat protein